MGVAGLIVGLLLVSWVFWSQISWNTRLDDAELEAYLVVGARTRDQKHALEELSKRFDAGAPGLDHWAEQVVTLSRSDGLDPSVQATIAWLMQYDAPRAAFRERLAELVEPRWPELVRRNAATSLAKARDERALPVLRAMLEPYEIRSPLDGTVESLIGPEQPVRAGDGVARLATTQDGEAQVADVRTPVPGTVLSLPVEEGGTVGADEALVVLRPSPEHLVNAAAALALVGSAEDAQRLRRALAGASRLPDAARELVSRAATELESNRDE